MKEKISITSINHRARIDLNLTLSEYVVADFIYQSSNNPKAEGWCWETKENIALYLGFTKRTITNIIGTLLSRGIIIKDEKTKFLKSTSTWYENVVILKIEGKNFPIENKPYERINQEGKEKTSLGGKKLPYEGLEHTDNENSVEREKTSLQNDEITKRKEKEKESNKEKEREKKNAFAEKKISVLPQKPTSSSKKGAMREKCGKKIEGKKIECGNCSRCSLIACTDVELWEIAKKKCVLPKYVRDKHAQIMEMVESGEFQRRYKKHKTVYNTLMRWIGMGIENGRIPLMNEFELMGIDDEHPQKKAEKEAFMKLVREMGVL